MRVVICGGPKTGKTTLGTKMSEDLRIPLVSTDGYINYPWEDVPDEIIRVLESLDEFVLEGVQAARVLRRWYKREDPRIDKVYWLERPFVQLSDRQKSMGKGISTVFKDVRPHLNASGVKVEGHPGRDHLN